MPVVAFMSGTDATGDGSSKPAATASAKSGYTSRAERMQSESDGRSRTHTSKRPAPSTRVGIINYGVGNIRSLRNAFAAIGAVPAVLSDPHDLPKVDRVVLPGVGAFVGAMARLRDQGWVEALQRVVLEQGKPLLGVCLGMQLLADRSTEHGGGKGLVDLGYSSPPERIGMRGSPSPYRLERRHARLADRFVRPRRGSTRLLLRAQLCLRA